MSKAERYRQYLVASVSDLEGAKKAAMKEPEPRFLLRSLLVFCPRNIPIFESSPVSLRWSLV